MKRISFVMLFFITPTYACNDISGTYSSVSETHWNFIIKIQNSIVDYEYSTYWYDVNDERQEKIVTKTGKCTEQNEQYILEFSDETIAIKHYKSLSQKSFGRDKFSPGIIGKFLNGRNVELWSFGKI
ncbi:MAG: hypothetical protein KAU29_02075 [Gammaproteobacteria bacterium]|nr:hypothetical protein [Gammaproteobacteria bacterium]